MALGKPDDHQVRQRQAVGLQSIHRLAQPGLLPGNPCRRPRSRGSRRADGSVSPRGRRLRIRPAESRVRPRGRSSVCPGLRSAADLVPRRNHRRRRQRHRERRSARRLQHRSARIHGVHTRVLHGRKRGVSSGNESQLGVGPSRLITENTKRTKNTKNSRWSLIGQPSLFLRGLVPVGDLGDRTRDRRLESARIRADDLRRSPHEDRSSHAGERDAEQRWPALVLQDARPWRCRRDGADRARRRPMPRPTSSSRTSSARRSRRRSRSPTFASPWSSARR